MIGLEERLHPKTKKYNISVERVIPGTLKTLRFVERQRTSSTGILQEPLTTDPRAPAAFLEIYK